MNKNIKTAGLVIALVTTLLGCASTASRNLSSSSDFDKVFYACKQAVAECGYGITSASTTDGFISAQQAVMKGQGSVVIMNIQVTRGTGGSSVQATVVPPPGTMGNINGILDKFTMALKSRVPDTIVTAQ